MIDQTKTYLTRKGLAASLAALDGHTFSISRIAVGDGVWPPDTDPVDIEALLSPRTDAENLIVSRVDGDTRRLHVEAVVTSAGVQEGFGIIEMGIYATLDEAELLYAVVLTPDYPDYVWPEASGVDNKTNIDFYLQVADAGAVMIIEGPSLYVTQARLQEALTPAFSGLSTLPADGWTPEGDVHYYDIPVTGITPDMIPELGPATVAASLLAAKINVLMVASVTSAIRIWVQKLPAQDIAVWYRVRRQ